MYKELWGRGVLRTIQEELLELIIVKYDVPFFYIFITRFQHFSAAVYILKKLTVFAFLQTKSLCILLKETQKGKKAASRWSGGEGGGEESQENADKNCPSPAFQQQTQAFVLPESSVSLWHP